MSNNGHTTGFIPDGYTRKGHIKADADWYPELNFEYRPMVQRERVRAQSRIREAKTDDLGETEAHKIICERLVSWDLMYDGQPVELSVANVERLEAHLSAKLLNVVVGWEPDDSAELSDADREETDAKN